MPTKLKQTQMLPPPPSQTEVTSALETLNSNIVTEINSLEIVTGQITPGSVNASSYKKGTVTFDTPLSGTPQVIVSVHTNSTGTNFQIVSSTWNESSTGFDWYCYNASSTNRNPFINYLAIYDGRNI